MTAPSPVRSKRLPVLGNTHVAEPERAAVRPLSAAQQVARERGRAFMATSRPQSHHVHLLTHDDGSGQLFLPDGSRLFDADAVVLSSLRHAMAEGGEVAALERLGVWSSTPYIDDTPIESPPLHALSLAVAQKCNLGCTYCYAQQGEFGGPATQMSEAQALAAVDLLVGGAAPDARLTIAYMGGEPLVNRDVLRAATRHAVALAADRGVHVQFSITTNGTLVREDDGDFFEQYGFAVTVSLDGPQAVHDAQRPMQSGRGSFDRIMRNITPLLAMQRRMQLSARVTVTPANLGLRATLDEFVNAGFHSVGFAPMLSAPTGQGEMQAIDLEIMLGEMIDCGHEYERNVAAGVRYPFANLVNALREIHRGTHRPYPCGAGAGYLGVSADGELSACHRFVGDDNAALGTIAGGVDREAQNRWLTERHVHQQTPCTQCWARYLCGGGCHHEVLARGRAACDYVRGWLHYCLGAYQRLAPIDAQLDGPLRGLV